MINNRISKGLKGVMLALGLALGINANANDAPVAFTSGGYTTAGVNSDVYFGSDKEDGTNIVVGILNAPTNGVLENIVGNIGSYKANTNYTGFDNFKFLVRDSQGATNVGSYTLYVKPNNVSPEIDKLTRANSVSTIRAKVQPSMDGQRVTRVYRNTDLSSTNWVHIGNISPTNYVGNGLVDASFTDNNSANLDKAFYRLETRTQ